MRLWLSCLVPLVYALALPISACCGDDGGAQIIGYLDCEFSEGRVRNGSIPWEIQHSTLPWREGHRLEFVDEISQSRGAHGVGPRRPGAERWTVPINTLAPGELTAL